MLELTDSLQKTRPDEYNTLFKHVFEEYYMSLLGYCNSFIKDDTVAKDIIQDSFKVLWEKRTNWLSKPNVSSILFSIVRNKSLNYLKHEKIELKYASELKHNYYQCELSLTAIEYDGCDLLIAKEMNTCIENAVAELPEKCRLVLELSRKKNLKNTEIADRLSISVKTVEAQITKALKHIRKLLNNHDK